MSAKGEKLQKLLIVDPNPCGSSVVNVEDLSISVELEVYRRSNEIIVFSENDNDVTKISGNPIEKTRISFIDGSGESDKVLKTTYTELNTKFNKDNPDLGTLGIESIDISFNTSYTPIVNIRFKDIRGKLFEMGNNSPYAFLFSLPYPIFYLTVKGYYGKPVTYALHLTKFNGSLDSDTGSFFIKCDFIGYTYAFLNDILMGFLLAIPFMPEAKGLIPEGFVNFEELLDIVQKLQENILKFKKEDEKLLSLAAYKDLNEKLDNIASSLKQSLRLIDSNFTEEEAVLKNVAYSQGAELLETTRDSYKDTTLKLVDDYIAEAGKYKVAGTYKINKESFELSSGGILYEKFKVVDFLEEVGGITKLKSYGTFIEDENLLTKYENFRPIQGDNNEVAVKNDIIKKKYDDFSNLLNRQPFTVTGGFSIEKYNVFDIRFALQEIDDIKNRINDVTEIRKNEVTRDFSQNLKTFFEGENINFDGSIGSFFRIICQHVDLFINVIRKLGIEIKSDKDSGNRTFSGSEIPNFSEYDSRDSNSTIEISAFPEFVEIDNDNDGALVEKWIGKSDKFSNFREVEFIENFFNAILKSAQINNERLENFNNYEKSWLPVNPLETKAFNLDNVSPWKTASNLGLLPIMKLLVQRMVIYLAFTNKDFDDSLEQIVTFAKIEANQVYNSLINQPIKNSLISSGANQADIDKRISQLISDLTQKYATQIISSDNGITYKSEGFTDITYIPVTQSASAIDSKENLLDTEDDREVTESTFISSVVSSVATPSAYRENETFIKILRKNQYNSGTFEYENYVPDTETSLVKNFNLRGSDVNNNFKIRDYSNSLGGKYKTHEFINYEDENVGEIPLFYNFYEFTFSNTKTYRKDNPNTEYDTFIENENGQFIYNTDVKRIKTEEDRKKVNSNYEITGFKTLLLKNAKNENLNNTQYKFEPTFISDNKKFSLFGSKFYYKQNDFGRAFLFLHSIPFAGLGVTGSDILPIGLLERANRFLFNQRAGFVSVPYSWILFMGAVLFRNQQQTDIITLNDANNKTYLPRINDSINISKDSYLIASDSQNIASGGNFVRTILKKGNNLEFFKDKRVYGYEASKVNDVIKNLPNSVKKIFIDEFTSWVEDPNGWIKIKDNLEIFSRTPSDSELNTVWGNLNRAIPSVSGSNTISILKQNVGTNYSIISPETETTEAGNFILDIRDDSPASNTVVSLLRDSRIILNGTYRIWEGSNQRSKDFVIPKGQYNKYLSAFFEEYSRINTPNYESDTDRLKEKIFKTKNNDDIKLSLYKNVKSIYEKWVVGVPQNIESTLVTNLFDRFKFMDRSYNDISTKFKISPINFIDRWAFNGNISFYTFIARILKDNHFDFIPLPTFINYNSVKDVEDIFKPFRFNEAVAVSGPQFICMYFGEQSNKLNIDKSTKFKRSDSFKLDVGCDNGTLKIDNSSELPKDFELPKNSEEESSTEITINNKEVRNSSKARIKNEIGSIPYVLVNYADQNQSVFKSFTLDQSEFTETQESLEVIDALSNQNRNNSIGQNLFDIYNNRSYSAEIEMLGCAQMQPFMYFQLNNIPMFDGAYTIINTTHSIKPNHMTTTFKGVRIRSVKTKLVDDETLYAHLITNLNDVNSENADLSEANTVGSDNSGNSEYTLVPAQKTENGATINNTDGIILIE